MIEIKAENVKYAETMLAGAPKQLQRSAVAAINSTITHIKAEISKTIRKKYVISAKDVKASITVDRAKTSNMQGSITSTGSPRLLGAFEIRGKNTKRAKKPLRVRIRRDNPLKPVKGLFSGRSQRGYVGLLHRTQSTAYPLRVPYGPSIPQMLDNPEVLAEIEAEAGIYLNNRFLHEVEHRLEFGVPDKRGKKK